MSLTRRTPLRRTAFKPAKRNPLRAECGRLCRLIVLARAGNRCVAAGEGGIGCGGALQGAHVLPKGRYRLMEFDLTNLIALCWRHHFGWWHIEPDAALAWFARRYPGELERLRLIATGRKGGRLDLEATLLWLRQEARRLGIE